MIPRPDIRRADFKTPHFPFNERGGDIQSSASIGMAASAPRILDTDPRALSAPPINSFFTFAPEMRHLIYKEYLAFPENTARPCNKASTSAAALPHARKKKIASPKGVPCPPPAGIGLLLTCSTIYNEAISLLYSKPLFAFDDINHDHLSESKKTIEIAIDGKCLVCHDFVTKLSEG